MNKFFAAAPMAFALAAVTVLPGCQSDAQTAPVRTAVAAPAAAPAPAPAPAPTAAMMAAETCESAVLTGFGKSRGHTDHQLNFMPDMRKATPGRGDLIAVTGAGSYTKADGKPVKVTYSCSYNAKTAKVVSSRFR